MAEIPDDVMEALGALGMADTHEAAVRSALEGVVPGYCLYKLTPAAARRWKCRYRVMIGAGYYDGQTAVEAYARALIDLCEASRGESVSS